MRYTLGYAAATLGVLLSVICTLSFGADLTGEMEELYDLKMGTYPLTLSTDGLWLFHADSANNLYRKKIDDSKMVESVQVGGRVRALSASRSGKKVGFLFSNGCVGIVTFTRGEGSPTTTTSAKTPSIVWLDKKLSKAMEDCDGKPSDVQYFGSHFSVALSSDGKFIAVAGEHGINVIDVASQRIAQVVPDLGALHISFVDSDRKLLVVKALMGEKWEGTGDPRPSNMQFAVWDLQKKELFSFYNTKKKDGLNTNDYLWSFSEASGELWTIRADESGHTPIFYTTNMKHCAGAKPTRKMLSQYLNLDFVADPLGRYVAEVEPVIVEKQLKRVVSNLRIRDSHNGKTLAQWRIDAELRSLTASHDGKTLYGTTSAQPESYGSRTYVGGGELKKFDLSEQIAALPKPAAVAWSEQHCLIEDEVPDAREIAIDAQERPRLFEIQLESDINQNCRKDFVLNAYERDLPAKWRQLGDGTLFIDRWSHLEQIDPDNGRVLRQFPTPRSESACSLPLYGQRQFLSWQGDSITLRPFAETVAATDRTELVKKPGWTAKSVELLGDRFGVRWIDNRYKGDASTPGRGSAMAIVYDMVGKQLAEIPGSVGGGNTDFYFADEEGNAEKGNVFDKYTAKSRQQGVYRWEESYAGSIRAYRRDNPKSPEKTVLWSGWRLEHNPEIGREKESKRGYSSRVFGLSGSLGAQVGGGYINVFDAETRHRLAQIKMQDVQNIAWNPINRVLLVETGSHDKGGSKLIAYRIE